MKLHGWGQYPIVDAEILFPISKHDCIENISKYSFIPRGLGRSYGDSANNEVVLQTTYLDHYINFDEINGILTCEAGISLHEILCLIVPKGWFLPVTPGTSFVTVGGAIASDVHGKNHHNDGTFSQHLLSLNILLADKSIITTSNLEHAELFYATCGGMGLTGVILSATIKLKPICSSKIEQNTIKTASLEDVLEQFEVNHNSTYSVAWVDCLAKGGSLGRSLLMLGEHSIQDCLEFPESHSLNIPFNMPSQLLNYYSIKAFNTIYYTKSISRSTKEVLPLASYFYPLDKLTNWNRLYGKQGFIQYQFVIPQSDGLLGLKTILKVISDSGKGSFLGTLKTFGVQNQNLLSFPIKGYTLALDFKIDNNIFGLIQKLDKLVESFGGRIYLAKDALMSELTFKSTYTKWQEFEMIREKYGAIGKFSSHQSKRLGLR